MTFRFSKPAIFYGGIIALCAVGIYVIAAPLIVIEWGRAQVFTDSDTLPHHTVAIVFGAGVRANSRPTDMLKDRLTTAAQLYHAGKINKLLVSGDNRVIEYNEPDVMKNYLVHDLKVLEQDVIPDYAGRSTYETCIRARKIWNVQKALLISQGYHLSRALLTCRSVGIESSGFSGTRQTYRGEAYFKLRELAAIHKALFNIYVWPPSYVGGPPEPPLN